MKKKLYRVPGATSAMSGSPPPPGLRLLPPEAIRALVDAYPFPDPREEGHRQPPAEVLAKLVEPGVDATEARGVAFGKCGVEGGKPQPAQGPNDALAGSVCPASR